MSELGELRRALWVAEEARSEAAWRELGRQAATPGWARRLVRDVLEGRTALRPDCCLPALEEWARGDPESVSALVRSADGAAASLACAGMARAGEEGGERVLQFSEDSAVAVRLAAIGGLGELAAAGSLRATEQLGRLLDDPYGEVRWAAAAALGRARRPACVAVAVAALRRASEGPDDRARGGAALGAAALFPVRPRVAVSLLRAIAGRSAAGVTAVAATLGELPWRAARPFLVLATDPDPARRRGLASAASRWGEEGRPILSKLVSDPDPTVRAAAAESLGGCAWEGAKELLQARAQDRVASVRAIAVTALARLGEGEAARQAARARDPVVRAAACAHLSDPELLLTLAEEGDATVARAALAALGAQAPALAGPIWERLWQASELATLAEGAAAGMAAALDRHPAAAGEVIWRWPVGRAGPEMLARIARAARHPEVSELARTACRALVSEDLAEALEDLSLALLDAGQTRAGQVCAWLARGARAKTQEEIAALREGGSGKAQEARSHLVSVAQALAARRPSRARASVEAALSAEAETLAGALAHQVARRWRELLAPAEEGATWAELQVTLPPACVIAGAAPTAVVRLNNAGGKAAQSVEIAVEGGQTVAAPEIPPGGSLSTPVTLGAAAPGRIEVRGEVRYRSLAGARRATFSGSCEAVAPGRLARAENPYVVGKPLAAGSAMFFGREQELAFAQRALSSGESGAVAALVGPRRCGKTSLLRQLEARLRGWHRPIFVDLQGLLVADVAAFFQALARRIAGDDYALRSEDVSGADLVREAANSSQRVVLLLDEFDEIAEKVRLGRLSQEVFGQLRNLLQHSPNLSVVLCGSHRLEELAGDYWSFLLNLAIYCPLRPLEEEAAREVITTPLARLGITCEDAAAWAAVELSGGQPYLLQSLGYRLVERCVSLGEGAVRYLDVLQVAEEVVEQGEIHLRYLWELAGPQGREALRQLASPRRALVRASEGAGAPPPAILRTLQALDLVTEQSGLYRLRVGLLGRWLASGEAEESR